jgi:ubiquinone/menaquinone biosynthesis C-methylase UbiE
MTTEFDAEYFKVLHNGKESEWHQLIKDEHELVLALMRPRPGDRILDVGCGKGRLGMFLLSQEPNIEMTFSDVTPEAKKYFEGYNFVECSMASMPFPDGYFDKIFCMHVIAHFAEGEQGVKEAFRVLKKGGKLMILTPNKYYVYMSRLITFLRRFRVKYDPTARWLYSRGSLERLLRKCSWTSIQFSYLQSAPKHLPFEWMRAKLIAVATK